MRESLVYLSQDRGNKYYKLYVESKKMKLKYAFLILVVSALVTSGTTVTSAQDLQDKSGSALTFKFGGGELTFYGHADVSMDYVDNGLSDRVGAVGNNGGMGEVSSNQSYFGIRGSHTLNDSLTGVFQLETEVAYSSTPGPSLIDPQIKNALGSRDSYVGLKGAMGALKIGKSDAPYKKSTSSMDPFSSSLGDYNSIIGNSGGDNRAEFDTRMPHAVWYESPEISGMNFQLLMSPGQNRGADNELVARGEPNCTGGNAGPVCGDGASGSQYSTAVTYRNGPIYGLIAYELHQNVNRTGDQVADFNGTMPVTGTANEDALKAGLQYLVQETRTTINLIFERLHRNAAVDTFNERTRDVATWLAISQKVTSSDELNFGWAHAGSTPGDPGGVNNQTIGGAPANVSGPVDNQANMFAIGYKHRFADNKTSLYLVGAQMQNQTGAHYDLGASGHGTVVDCKDGNPGGDGTGSCFAGTTITAVSMGMTYDF